MKILLLSDASMNVDKGGFPQTLYNIFSFINPQDFLFITSEQAYKIAPTSQPFTLRTLTYNLEIIPLQKNRFGNYINSFINWFNLSYNQQVSKFRKIKFSIKNFNPDIIITAPNGAEGLFIFFKLKSLFKDKKVFPYLMDDWLYQSRTKWFNGNIHSLAKKMLAENDCWMMISKNLADIFSERYKIQPSKVLEIHNPVNIKTNEQPQLIKNKKSYTLAYAGALWQMHFDAFLIVAKAIKLLQKHRSVELILYTSKSNWNWRQSELKDLNVVYGGFIPYKQIHEKLADADCLIVTSSFTDEWKTHSKGSVQTKITDYLKASRLIISCGPAYSANHQFLKKYNCGICIETNNVEDVATKINNILNNIEANQEHVALGFKVLKQEFSFEKVHQKLKAFLAA